MTILELYATFAGLDDKKLELKPGLNIIEGANESGKSTWCAFIRAMLYGIDTSERDRVGYIAEKNRFRPWNGAPISGVMKLDTPLGGFTIERKSTASAPLKTVVVIDGTGAEVALSTADLGERFCGVGREVFERSAFVQVPEFAGGSGELERRVLATVSDGDDGAGHARAAAVLRDWKNRLKSNSVTGLIPRKLSDIALLEKALRDTQENEQTVAESHALMRELNARREVLERELTAHRAADRQQASNELRKAREQLEMARAEKIAAQEMLPAGMPGIEELQELQRAVADERVRRAEYERRRSDGERRASIEAQLDEFPAVYRSDQVDSYVDIAQATHKKLGGVWYSKAFVTIYIALCVALGAGMLLLLDGWIAYALPVVPIAAIVARSVQVYRSRKNHAEMLRRFGVTEFDEISDKLERYRSLKLALEQFPKDENVLPSEKRDLQFTVIAAQLQALFGCDTLEEASGLLPRVIVAAERLAMALAAEHAAGMVVASLEKAVGTEVDINVVNPTMPQQQAQDEMDRLERQIAEVLADAARAEGRLGDADSATIAADIEREREILHDYNRRYAAIETAQSALDGASARLRERFSPALTAETSRVFARLTDNRYERANIGRSFVPEAGNDDSSGLRALSELSSGTADQLWFALRLAICRTVLHPGLNAHGPAPLILDDALLCFDRTRLKLALDVLREEATTRQVLIFTCHDRERRALTEQDDVHYVNLLC